MFEAFGEARFCAYAWESLRATGAVIENAEILGSDSMAGSVALETENVKDIVLVHRGNMRKP